MRAAEGGVRFDPEKMEGEKLYHCVFGGKLVLVFKDSQDFVHCYEVEEPELVRMAESAPPGAIGEMLEGYINTLNKKPPGAPEVRELAEPGRDAEDILSEFASKREAGSDQDREKSQGAEPETPAEAGAAEAPVPADAGPQTAERPAEEPGREAQDPAEPQGSAEEPGRQEGQKPERNVIFVGTKPIMTYVNATLQQMASYKVVTIKARGKRITQAVDVSQMIVKRMNAVGYVVSDVRISSDSLKSQDGRERNVSTVELDIARS